MKLTKRQAEALRLRVQHPTLREKSLAKLMGVSLPTWKHHLKMARHAKKATSTLHLIAIAHKQGLIDVAAEWNK